MRAMTFRTLGLAFLAAFLLLSQGALSTPGSAAALTFYVDASGGADGNDGLTPATAWQSLAKVNSSTLAPGTNVLFKRGETWRGQLMPASGAVGAPVTYGAYGSGNKPLLLGSVSAGQPGDWVAEGANIWRSQQVFAVDVGNIIFDGAAAFGIKKWSAPTLTSQGDYWYDRATGYVRMYSTANPASLHANIELALRKHIIDQTNASYVTYDGLALKYGAAHGIGGGGTHDITVRNCEISYIGGGDLNQDGSNIRFGNGIEFWGNAHDNLVERCKIWEIYDTALTNQNHTQTALQYNITYRNNLIWNAAYASFEYWSRPAASQTNNIRFENNTAAYAGRGWGTQRPDPVGAHVLLGGNYAATQSILIRDNVFYEATGAGLLTTTASSQWITSLTEDYNCWYQSSAPVAVLYELNLSYTMAQFAAYQSFTGKGAHSIVADPKLANASGADLRLLVGSPCIDAGIDVGSGPDFDGVARPQGSQVDIGAFEYRPAPVGGIAVAPDRAALPARTPEPAGGRHTTSVGLAAALAGSIAIAAGGWYMRRRRM